MLYELKKVDYTEVELKQHIKRFWTVYKTAKKSKQKKEALRCHYWCKGWLIDHYLITNKITILQAQKGLQAYLNPIMFGHSYHILSIQAIHSFYKNGPELGPSKLDDLKNGEKFHFHPFLSWTHYFQISKAAGKYKKELMSLAIKHKWPAKRLQFELASIIRAKP